MSGRGSVWVPEKRYRKAKNIILNVYESFSDDPPERNAPFLFLKNFQ